MCVTVVIGVCVHLLHRITILSPDSNVRAPLSLDANADLTACQRLVMRSVAPSELISQIEAVFSGGDESDMVHSLHGDDAQIFIDVIDEALDTLEFSPLLRKKCLKLLYRMCGRHALLPEALKVPVYYGKTGVALYRGGFGDVWKGEYCGRDVAVKVLRTYSNSDLQKIIGVGHRLRSLSACWRSD